MNQTWTSISWNFLYKSFETTTKKIIYLKITIHAPLFHYFLFILFDSTHLLPALHYVTSYILRSKNKTNRWRKGDWKIKNTFYSKSNTRKTCASLINNSIKNKNLINYHHFILVHGRWFNSHLLYVVANKIKIYKWWIFYCHPFTHLNQVSIRLSIVGCRTTRKICFCRSPT